MGAPVASGTLAGSTSGSWARIHKDAARSDFSPFRRHPPGARLAQLCRPSRSPTSSSGTTSATARTSSSRSASTGVRASSISTHSPARRSARSRSWRSDTPSVGRRRARDNLEQAGVVVVERRGRVRMRPATSSLVTAWLLLSKWSECRSSGGRFGGEAATAATPRGRSWLHRAKSGQLLCHAGLWITPEGATGRYVTAPSGGWSSHVEVATGPSQPSQAARGEAQPATASNGRPTASCHDRIDARSRVAVNGRCSTPGRAPCKRCVAGLSHGPRAACRRASGDPPRGRGARRDPDIRCLRSSARVAALVSSAGRSAARFPARRRRQTPVRARSTATVSAGGRSRTRRARVATDCRSRARQAGPCR